MQKEFSTKLYYPNPLQPQGIVIELPEDAEISIELFTGDGIQKENLVENKMFPAGKHKIIIPGDTLERGIYYCRLRARGNQADYSDTHTIIIE